MLKATEILH